MATVKGNGDAAARECGREAEKLPARILACGLGRALAFLAARAKKDKKPALKALEEGIAKHVAARIRPREGEPKGSLLERVVNSCGTACSRSFRTRTTKGRSRNTWARSAPADRAVLGGLTLAKRSPHGWTHGPNGACGR